MDPIEHALRLAHEAERDPVRAVQHAEHIRTLLERARRAPSPSPAAPKAAGEGDIGRALLRLARVVERLDAPLSVLSSSHIVRVDDVPSLNPGQVSPALKIDWPGGEGIARSLYGGTLDGDPGSLSMVSVRIAINGSDDLFTTGEAPAFVPLVAFQAANHNWFRLKDYRVSPAQKWTVYFQHEGPAGSGSITPFLLFGFAQGRNHTHD